MTNHENPQPTREYKVYIPNGKQWITVTEEQYYAYYRDIWCTQKRAQAHGQCMCPKSKLWQCDGDCLVCRYHAAGDSLSLDHEYENENGEESSLLDSLVDPSADVESTVMDRLCLEALYEAIRRLNPDGRCICELLLQDKSESEIADLLNMKQQSTVNYRKKKAFDELRELLKDII